VAQRKSGGPRKRRTREHIIADLSVNHVERHVLRAGYTIQRIDHDYGIDLVLHTFNAAGEYESGELLIQVKATERVKVKTQTQQHVIPWRLQRADLLSWLHEPLPVILIVYDATQDQSWWLYLQRYFGRPGPVLRLRTTVTVHVPLQNRLDESAIRHFAQMKAKAVSQAHGAIRHDE